MADTLIETGWGYHDRESEKLAAELEAAAADKVRADELDSFINLSNHTLGEHLADWPRARRLAERAIGDHAPTAQNARAWSRLGVARLMAGDGAGATSAELAGLAAAPDPLAAMIEARFLLVAALIGAKRAPEAAAIYERALALADRLGDAAPARPIAVASNNLASELVEAPARTAEEDALMAAAAEAAHVYWKRCGTWVHDERALYLKTLVANALGKS